MSKWIRSAAIAIFALGIHSSAHAGGMFGVQDELHDIQDTNDPEYKLGFKVRLYFVFAGVYVSDDGYVLLKKGTSNSYFPLSADDIAKNQESGVLPTPLPPYSIPFWDYLFGYSLWIVIGVIMLIGFLKSFWKKLQGPPEQMADLPPQPTQPTGPSAFTP